MTNISDIVIGNRDAMVSRDCREIVTPDASRRPVMGARCPSPVRWREFQKHCKRLARSSRSHTTRFSTSRTSVACGIEPATS